jgi:hypothetical protein
MLHLVGCVINVFLTVCKVLMEIYQLNMLFNVECICIVNWKGLGRYTLWPISSHFPGIHVEVLNKNTTSHMHDRQILAGFSVLKELLFRSVQYMMVLYDSRGY